MTTLFCIHDNICFESKSLCLFEGLFRPGPRNDKVNWLIGINDQIEQNCRELSHRVLAIPLYNYFKDTLEPLHRPA